MFHQARGHRKGQFRVEIHTHLGEFHAYIGVQLALLYGIEQAMIHLRCLLRFLGRMDILSQAIERGRDSLAIDRSGCLQHLFDAGPGYEAGGHAATECGIFRETT